MQQECQVEFHHEGEQQNVYLTERTSILVAFFFFTCRFYSGPLFKKKKVQKNNHHP